MHLLNLLSHFVGGALLLVCRVASFGMLDTVDMVALAAGMLGLALFLAIHFSRLNNGLDRVHPDCC